MSEVQELDGQFYLIANKLDDNLVVVDVFDNEDQASQAYALATAADMNPTAGKIDKIKFEGDLPGVRAMFGESVMFIRWDQPGTPGYAEALAVVDARMAAATSRLDGWAML